MLRRPEGALLLRLRFHRDTAKLQGAADGIAAVFGFLLHGQKRPVREGAGGQKASVLAGGIARIVGVALRDDGGAHGAVEREDALPLQAGDDSALRRELLVRKAHKAGHFNMEQRAAFCAPVEAAAQNAVLHVQHAPVLGDRALAEVEPLPIRAEAQALGVHDIADRLVIFRVAVGLFAVDNGFGVENAVQEAALNTLGPACPLLQVAAQADKAVGEGEDGFIFPEIRGLKALLRNLPGLIGKFWHR